MTHMCLDQNICGQGLLNTQLNSIFIQWQCSLHFRCQGKNWSNVFEMNKGSQVLKDFQNKEEHCEHEHQIHCIDIPESPVKFCLAIFTEKPLHNSLCPLWMEQKSIQPRRGGRRHIKQMVPLEFCSHPAVCMFLYHLWGSYVLPVTSKLSSLNVVCCHPYGCGLFIFLLQPTMTRSSAFGVTGFLHPVHFSDVWTVMLSTSILTTRKLDVVIKYHYLLMCPTF